MGSLRSSAQVLLLCILSAHQAEIDAPSIIILIFPHALVFEEKCLAASAAMWLTGMLASLDYSSKCPQITEN